MTTSPKDLQVLLHDIIDHQCTVLEHNLSVTERTFVVRTLEDFVRSAIPKYISGSKEHGEGFLTEVDHVREMKAETIDLLFYTAGAQYRKTHNG